MIKIITIDTPMFSSSEITYIHEDYLITIEVEKKFIKFYITTPLYHYRKLFISPRNLENELKNIADLYPFFPKGYEIAEKTKIDWNFFDRKLELTKNEKENILPDWIINKILLAHLKE